MLNYLRHNKLILILTVFFSIISSFAYVFIAMLLQQILDTATSKDVPGFIKIVIFSLCYFALLGLFMYLYSLFSKKLICKTLYLIRSKTFQGIVNHNIEDFNKVNSADYLSALTNDVKLVEDNYLLPLLEIIQYGIIFIASLGVMLYFDVIVTICVIVAILLMFIIPGLFGKAMQDRQDKFSQNLSGFTNHVKDMLSGFEVIKSYRMKKFVRAKFDKSNHSVTDSKYSVDKMIAANESVSMVLAILVQLVVIFMSAYFIIIGRITAGTLLGMVQVSSNLSNPLLMIFSNVPKLKSVKPVIERLNALSDYDNDGAHKTLTPEFQTEISAKELSFSYDSGIPVLKDVSIRIEKGRKYAIVGKSGCGKSTLIKLLTGCYSEYSGTIEYDDKSITEMDYDKLAELTSTIHQNVYMFDESIYDNICLHDDYAQEALDNALEISGVNQFLEQTPEGLFSMAGENGSNLSGGQKQRIAVARAVIRKKPILILDEGTSAIDMQTAYDIESRLLKMKGLTLLTITHNMSEDILGLYDTIIYMNEGVIEEIGSFEELVAKQGCFYNFYQLKKD